MRSKRIERLRRQSEAARPTLSPERAVLATRFYANRKPGNSTPVTRAEFFRYLLAEKAICINEDELIVGERGPAAKAAPTYPELCVHSEADLSIIDTRKKVSFRVSCETKEIYRREVIPFWAGHSVRDKIFTVVPPEWITAYEAGVFTEFQEQRAPGHTVLGDKIYRMGLTDIIAEIRDAVSGLDPETDPRAFDKREQLSAMEIAAGALIRYAERHAEVLTERAADETDETRKAELLETARICRKVPAHAPETFREALQYYWFVHVGVITESNPWDAFNPGRLDRHLYPFYRRDIAEGRLTEELAKELLMALWVKFNNHPAPPKVGVTARESNTYTDFALINLGGVTTGGEDAVNELTYLILDVIEEMRLLQPSSMVQVSKKSPDRFLKRALSIVKTGFGQPSIFNTDAIIQELVRQGKCIEDARDGGASGCVESGAFGREAYILTGYVNLPKILEITLQNGLDPRTNRRVGPKTGDPAAFPSFAALFSAFIKQLNHVIDIKIRGNNLIERIHARLAPVPFLSLLIDDCIKKGRDYNDGGARYNTSYIQGVGLGTVVDSLTSIKVNVFENRRITMGEMLTALECDFAGEADLRRVLTENTPKYGNDDDRADDILRRVFDAYFTAVDGRPNTRGGMHRINLLPTTVHVYFGSVVGATPDGRRAQTPLSEGISPVQGADRKGPTAVIRSAAKIDHLKTGGTLLNQKFLPDVVKDDTGIVKLMHLVRTYFRLDGHHVQFNVVDAKTLMQAKAAPEQYRDLIVRVAGYSDYFVDLTEDLQDEIIRRTAHGEFS